MCVSRRPGLSCVGRHGLTSSEYQKAFNEQIAAGFRLVSVSGESQAKALAALTKPFNMQALEYLQPAGNIADSNTIYLLILYTIETCTRHD